MIAQARSAYILKRLEEEGIIDYKSISRELNVSEATVRRDFEKLESTGQLRRVQGGAMRAVRRMGELSVIAKNSVNVKEKRLVAQAAAQEVQEGECVFLDCGTSLAPMAEFLLHKRIRIVTINALFLPLVHQDTLAEIYVVGGRFSPADQMLTGPLSEEMLASFTFQHAFIGCTGWDPGKNAVYVTDLECLALKRRAMHSSDRSVLLIDSSKEHKHGLYRLAGVTDFDCVYVDSGGKCSSYPENFVVV